MRPMGAGLPARKGAIMGQPVVHFEIIGKDPAKLRSYFGGLFGWEFDTSSPVAEAVSEPLYYVGVPDVEAALQKAERLGGKRRMGPERAPTGLVVGHFTDPEGNVIGVAGPA